MFKKKEQHTHHTISSYEDPLGGLSGRDLELATWWVRHKEQIRKITLGVWIGVDALLLGYGLWGWISYVSFLYPLDQQMLVAQTQTFQDYTLYQSTHAAVPLQFGSPDVFRSGDGLYDFVTDVTNPNDRWIATVTYQFSYAGGVTEPTSMKIMPRSTQLLADIGIAHSSRPDAVRFEPLSVGWNRISSHDVPDVEMFVDQRNTFLVDAVESIPPADISLGGEQVSFTLTNESVFSYWSAQFYVELLDGTRREGVVLLTVDQLGAGAAVPVDLRLFGDTPAITDVVLYPSIDFFDPSEYMD